MYMAEPFYHCVNVDKDLVYNDIIVVIRSSHEWKNLMKISQRLPYLIHDIGFLHSAINSSIDDVDTDSCSIRGYACSIRLPLVNSVKDKILVYRKIKALMVLSNSNIVQNWVNHILYRPPGPRYALLKKEFESLVH